MSGQKELYTPRKCTATNRLIQAKDHGSVQINVGEVDESGLFTGGFSTVAFSGFIRKKGEADQAMNRVCAARGLIANLDAFPGEHLFRPVKTTAQ